MTTICLQDLLFNQNSPLMTSLKAVLTHALVFRFRAGGVFVYRGIAEQLIKTIPYSHLQSLEDNSRVVSDGAGPLVKVP